MVEGGKINELRAMLLIDGQEMEVCLYSFTIVNLI